MRRHFCFVTKGHHVYIPANLWRSKIWRLSILHYALHPPPTPKCQQHQHPHSPPPVPTNCLRTLYDVLHDVHGIKMRFHRCNDEQIFVCKNVPETVQWIKKVRILWKKWTKFQTKAQKCSKVHFIREIWCSNREIGRFDEKLGDSRENRESWQVWNLL